MRRAAAAVIVAAICAASTLAGAAQVGGKPVSGGNPTPGTAQPDPPNLGDRITLTGCLLPAPRPADAAHGPIDDNTPVDSRFVLTGGQRVNRVPPGTGQSEVAAKAPGGVYRLEGLDSHFSPFVNTRVEISGEIKAAAAGARTLVLLVEFVQKINDRCLPTPISAPSGTGRIEGTMASTRGPLAGIEVRVKNTTTAEVVAATTTPAGAYSIAVTPGTYEVFATPVGYAAFARRQVAVVSGAATRVDGTLTDNPNAGTPGEIYFLYARNEQKSPSGPAPQTAGGTPDLSGVWLPGPDLEPEVPPFQPWAEALAKERAGRVGDDPRARCLPSGVVRTNNLDLAKFIQTPGLLVMLVEGSVPGVRQVFLDGRAHPPDPQPTWLGHSVGRWDHDTLVIDTVGFNDKVWLDNAGRPQTERLHVVERFRRLDLGRLELEITIDDPGAYTRPWKVRRVLHLAAHEEIQEYICNENNRTEHFVAH